jgi:hypothetical protein
MASPRLGTGATIRTSAPSPLSSTLGRWVRITSSYRVPRSVMRRAGSSVSTPPATPSRTTEPPVLTPVPDLGARGAASGTGDRAAGLWLRRR